MGRDWNFLNADGAPLPLEATPLADVLAGSSPQQFVVGYRHPDGNRRWLDMNVGPLAHTRYRRPPRGHPVPDHRHHCAAMGRRIRAEAVAGRRAEPERRADHGPPCPDQYVNDAFEAHHRLYA